jgi:hypothetical protein
VVRGWRCAWMILCFSCAGDLRDPNRFDFLLNDSGAEAKDAGMPMSKADASVALPSCAADLFKNKCSSAACHGADAPRIDLISTNADSRLIDQPSSSTGMCPGRTLVASDGSASLLLDKLSDQPPCGGKMPAIGMLTVSERTCLTDWVNAVSGGKE